MKKAKSLDFISLVAQSLALIMMLTFTAYGLGFLSLGVNALYQKQQAKSWPSVVGKITKVTIKPCHRGRSCRHITYLYNLQNRTFSGNKEYFGSILAKVDETNGGYYKNTPVKIFYNPQQLNQSVLKPHSFRGIVLALLFGFMTLLITPLILSKVLLVVGKLLYRGLIGGKILPPNPKILKIFIKISHWNKAIYGAKI